MGGKSVLSSYRFIFVIDNWNHPVRHTEPTTQGSTGSINYRRVKPYIIPKLIGRTPSQTSSV